MTLTQLQNFLASVSETHVILGYGSLMNADSRARFSGIEYQGIPVRVAGFERGWLTRSYHESQTYVGAVRRVGASLNAQLIPVLMNPSLAQRERDYLFTQVSPEFLTFALDEQADKLLRHWLSERAIWICETTDAFEPDSEFPVSQTYVDTCLAGCLSHGGTTEATFFIRHTSCWPESFRDDRLAPVYPRAGRVDEATLKAIDALLAEHL